MSRLPRLNVIIILCAIVSITAGIYWYTQSSPSIEDLLPCLEEKQESRVDCEKPVLRQLLQDHTGAEIMTFLKTRVPSGMCHEAGHVVGQQMYQKNKSVERSIAECGYECFSACVHGIIGAALVEEAGVTSDTDGVHFGAEEIQKHGKRLCVRENMCHGVGHLLFQIYDGLEEAADVCTNIADGFMREACYGGVFMEHAGSPVTQRIFLETTRHQEKRLDDLTYPCMSMPPAYRNACFLYHPRLQYHIFDDLGITDFEEKTRLQRTACESIASVRDRSSCFEGFGFYYRFAEDSILSLHTVCDTLEQKEDRAACAYGAAYSLSMYLYTEEAFAFCANTPGAYERSLCYRRVFESTKFLTMRTKYLSDPDALRELERLCTKDTPHSAGCLEELTKFKDDP